MLTNHSSLFVSLHGRVDPHRSIHGRAKIYTSIKFKKENRKELIEILDDCHEKGIPTVFWNKEDPVHFSDRINDFIRTSALFDYVFTTAVECVDLYIRDVGVPYADVLPFAVQPKLLAISWFLRCRQ